MAKLAVIFEIPDEQTEAYTEAATRMIQSHQFATEQAIKHWSFDQEMRPVSAALIGPDLDGTLTAAIAQARREVDQDHPWIPGGTFLQNERLKPLLLALLAGLAD